MERCATSNLSKKAALNKDRNRPNVVFQHRHFAKIAEIIANADVIAILGKAEKTNFRTALTEYFANELKDTNPNFDRERFTRACLEEK